MMTIAVCSHLQPLQAQVRQSSIITLSIDVMNHNKLIVFPSHINEGLEYRPSKTPKKCHPVSHGIVSNIKNRKHVI
jgi:hypothetical protein